MVDEDSRVDRGPGRGAERVRAAAERQQQQPGEQSRRRAVADLLDQDFVRQRGVPREKRQRLFELTNIMLGMDDPELTTTEEDGTLAMMEMFFLAQELAERHRANPQDDITSIMMAAEVDGEQLTPQEFGSFFILLVVAGNETTRNAISHGMKALTEHPDQRELLRANYTDLALPAADEIVRWARA